MDQQNSIVRKPTTVLEGDGYYFDRLLMRDSSIGHSSRVYYPSSGEGIPFQWERQPGTPIHPLKGEVIPPLTPPPSLQSLGLPMPCADQPKDTSNRWKVHFFRRRISNKKECKEKRNVSVLSSSDKLGSLETLFKSDREFVGSLDHHNSSSNFSASSSSSTSSSSNCHAMQSRGSREDSVELPFVCSPWNITALLREEKSSNNERSKEAVSMPLGDGFGSSKIVSRNSSDYRSSRMYYDHSTEGGLIQPGKSKNHQVTDQVIPRPSPPTAAQRHGLPRPCIEDSTTSRLWFMHKCKKIHQISTKVQKNLSFKFASFYSSS